MVRFWTPPGCDVSLGVILDRFDPDAVIAELRRAGASGDQRPGQDRLTLLDPAIGPEQMTLEGFMRIYRVSVTLETPPGGGDLPKSVFVNRKGRGSRGPRVYIAMRRNLPGNWSDFQVAHSVAQASAILRVADLSWHFADYPQLSEFLTRQ